MVFLGYEAAIAKAFGLDDATRVVVRAWSMSRTC